MRMPRVNITKMMNLRTLVTHRDVTARQRRSVKNELPLVRIGLTCPVPVVATVEVTQGKKWARRTEDGLSIRP